MAIFNKHVGMQHYSRKVAFTLSEGATHVDRKHDYRKYAFTLSEVLITIGVLGIVAAMTMPTLLNRSEHKVLEAQRGKAASIVSTGYQKLLAEAEVFYMKDIPLMNCSDVSCFSKEHKSAFSIVADGLGTQVTSSLPDSYLIEGADPVSSPFKTDDVYVFITPDGMVYGLDLNKIDRSESYSFDIYADVNGIKNPNTVGEDFIVFNVTGQGALVDITESFIRGTQCSLNNPSGCSEAQCNAFPSCAQGAESRTHWENGTCHVVSCDVE